MGKAVKIWIGEEVGGESVKRRSMKALCLEIGLSYNTAKKGQGKGGERRKWVIGDKVWTVWVERVE